MGVNVGRCIKHFIIALNKLVRLSTQCSSTQAAHRRHELLREGLQVCQSIYEVMGGRTDQESLGCHSNDTALVGSSDQESQTLGPTHYSKHGMELHPCLLQETTAEQKQDQWLGEYTTQRPPVLQNGYHRKGAIDSKNAPVFYQRRWTVETIEQLYYTE